MEFDKKMPKIKSEPTDNPYDMESDADEVAHELSVVLLRPDTNQRIGRLLFERPYPRKMDSCASRMKKEVKHLELIYQTAKNRNGESINKLASLYDGSYNGENLNKNETLLRESIGFFKSGRFYIVPLSEAYEMHRKIEKKKAKEENETDDIINRNKLDDSRLMQVDETPDIKPIRVSYARHETDWQKKRREQSAQYKQQVIDSDPWVNLQVKKQNVRHVYKDKVERTENGKPALFNSTNKLPVL